MRTWTLPIASLCLSSAFAASAVAQHTMPMPSPAPRPPSSNNAPGSPGQPSISNRETAPPSAMPGPGSSRPSTTGPAGATARTSAPVQPAPQSLNIKEVQKKIDADIAAAQSELNAVRQLRDRLQAENVAAGLAAVGPASEALNNMMDAGNKQRLALQKQLDAIPYPQISADPRANIAARNAYDAAQSAIIRQMGAIEDGIIAQQLAVEAASNAFRNQASVIARSQQIEQANAQLAQLHAKIGTFNSDARLAVDAEARVNAMLALTNTSGSQTAASSLPAFDTIKAGLDVAIGYGASMFPLGQYTPGVSAHQGIYERLRVPVQQPDGTYKIGRLRPDWSAGSAALMLSQLLVTLAANSYFESHYWSQNEILGANMAMTGMMAIPSGFIGEAAGALSFLGRLGVGATAGAGAATTVGMSIAASRSIEEVFPEDSLGYIAIKTALNAAGSAGAVGTGMIIVAGTLEAPMLVTAMGISGVVSAVVYVGGKAYTVLKPADPNAPLTLEDMHSQLADRAPAANQEVKPHSPLGGPTTEGLPGAPPRAQ